MGFFPVTIAAGQSLSDAVDISSAQVFAIIMPEYWTPAPITFQLSIDNVEFFDLSHVETTDIFMLPWGPKHWVPLRTADFPKGLRVKIRSGHPFGPVPQEQERVLLLVNDAVVSATEPT